jgi:hypothetical protein
VSLARRLQDPLRELSGLCAGMGQDVLSLRLHPLQEVLQKPDLLKFMHRAFINVVNEVGVDINLAADKQLLYGNTVQAQMKHSQNTQYSDLVMVDCQGTDCRDFFFCSSCRGSGRARHVSC